MIRIGSVAASVGAPDAMRMPNAAHAKMAPSGLEHDRVIPSTTEVMSNARWRVRPSPLCQSSETRAGSSVVSENKRERSRERRRISPRLRR